jgi:formamidopyrimidine-DNA glycosylase
MPELPDVELVRRRLQDGIGGAIITAAESSDRHVLRPQSPRAFGRALAGRTVREVNRRGKWLRILLDDDARLFSHLGMTGWWVERDRDGRNSDRNARIDVVRDDGRPSSVRYLDSRRFGRLIVATEDIREWRSLDPIRVARH